MHILWMIVIGGIVGALAKLFMPGKDPGGLIVTVLLGILILWTWPLNSAWVLGTLLGVSMLFSGTARLMMSLAARRLATDLI